MGGRGGQSHPPLFPNVVPACLSVSSPEWTAVRHRGPTRGCQVGGGEGHMESEERERERRSIIRIKRDGE